MAFDETYDEPEYTEVLVKSLDPGHPVELRYAHAGDAGADLVAAEDVTLKPFQRALVPTGMAIALPAGYVALVHPRSGLAVKYGVTVLNAPGTIDAGYRGEVKVPLINLDPEHTMEFHRGDRIAQLVIQRYVRRSSSRRAPCRVPTVRTAVSAPPACHPDGRSWPTVRTRPSRPASQGMRETVHGGRCRVCFFIRGG